MTHKDTTMLERACNAAGGVAMWDGDPVRQTLTKDELFDIVRAILNELKTPSEGMVEAAQWAIEKNIARGVGYQAVSLGLISALDHVLNEGEG